jgi:stearoyl-CoA desaturase (delta-9 desaturase)
MPWTGRPIPEVIAIVTFYHIVALLALLPHFFSWAAVWVAVFSAYFFAAGIGIGYHRLLAHRSFSCSKRVEYFFAILGLLSVQRGPAWWAATHRRHHQHPDCGLDPHSPRPSILWAHMGWFFYLNENTDPTRILDHYAKDLMADRFYAWIETSRGWFLIVVASWLFYFSAGYAFAVLTGSSVVEGLRMGLSFVVWGVFLRTVYTWHLTWATASCTHRFGYRNYQTADDSCNNALLGIIAFGEGWGNNHHAKPQSPRFTAKWWEIDLSWLAIKGLACLGLVKINAASLHATPREPVLEN